MYKETYHKKRAKYIKKAAIVVFSYLFPKMSMVIGAIAFIADFSQMSL